MSNEIKRKIRNEMNTLRSSLYVTENGKKLFKTQKTRQEILKYAEFSIRHEDYIRFANFLESVLQDIENEELEEIEQFEEAEEDYRENRTDAYLGI